MSLEPRRSAAFLLVALLVALPRAEGTEESVSSNDDAARAASDFFEKSIRPVLAETCLKCHGPQKQSSSLRLDSREALLKGGDNGPAVVPGKPEESLLVQVVEQTHEEMKMPPKGKLPDAALSAIRQWVEQGAPWGAAASGSPQDSPEKPHWAFVPPKKSDPPAVNDPAWVKSPVDAFVLSKLEKAGLSPSPGVDRRTLIRRATLDLWGIPPTDAEVIAFQNDKASDAYEKLIDRLLASPLYGERWGRHWLDVARYADTKGYVFNEDRKYHFAYTYRDYVVRAFNEDLPFDQFVMQQIAADQIDSKGDPRPLAAMGFLTVGRRFLNDQNEIIDDRIDLVSRGLLGLSVSCARCHDHKFDPIPSEDYYSLYGVFASSIEPNELPKLDPPGSEPEKIDEPLRVERDKAVAKRDAYLASRLAELREDYLGRGSKYLKAAFDLEFNPRHPKIDERAASESLSQTRLRAMMRAWKRGLDRADAAENPILGPVKRFAALSKEEFAAKAAEVCASLSSGDAQTLPASWLREHPPTKLEDVVAGYVELLAGLETRIKDQGPEAAKNPKPLDDPAWESFRQALYGDGGVFAFGVANGREILNQSERDAFARLTTAVKQAEAKAAGKRGRAMVMNDAPTPVNPHVFVRGNPGRPGKQVPRQFLKVLAGEDRKPFEKGSGRLELAQAIVDPANPLTARVLVNRVWRWHFGEGLITTPSDFGLRTDPASHPELLDTLARTFVEEGWSIKNLHRAIMLSNTYQQASEARDDCVNVDPQNRLLWRFNRQRLDFEALRDSILAVAGSLDLTVGGPSLAINEAPFPPRRSIYGLVDRSSLDGVYRTFDFAMPDATNPKRFVTTVPQQALYLMNSPFIREQVKRVAESVERESGGKDLTAEVGPEARDERFVRQLYHRVLAREPETRELQLGLTFLGQSASGNEPLSPLAQLAQVLMLTNEFTFVD